jgi:hypothetical protein
MSVNWRQKFFEKLNCQGVTLSSGNGDVVVRGTVQSKTLDPVIVFWAANPADYRTSFSGSGFPFASPSQAYDKTPNSGAVRAVNRAFEFRIKMPNAYYAALGSVYVAPHVNIKVCENGEDDKHHVVDLGEGVPYRTLTYPSLPVDKPRISPMFYCQPELPTVRSQEQILRDSAYPLNHETKPNFWGTRPAR